MPRSEGVRTEGRRESVALLGGGGSRALGEAGQAPLAHLLPVKCGHLPSRSSAST